MRYVLGVDGGATKTYAILGDTHGHIWALGKGGPGNHQAQGGIDRAMGCIAEAVESACQSVGISPADLEYACFCLAGADLPSDYELLGNAIGQRWPGLRFSIKNDTFAGLRAGAPKGWGVVSICGTGNNCAGLAPDGRELQVGGLGYLMGDFGGANDLGREAIRAAFQAVELRGPATRLVQTVLDGMGYANMDDLREGLYLNTADRSRINWLAPRVFDDATAGDRVAQDLLIRMGTLLGESVTGAIYQLHMTELEVDVVMAGSVWKGANPLMVDAFRLAVHRAAPKARLLHTRYEPVVGAWLLGLEAAGVKPCAELYRRAETSMPSDLPINEEESSLWQV